jgi:hypothetical protein
MTQRLTFAVAGKTNGFQTKLPLPAVVYTFIILTVLGMICLGTQIVKRNAHWLAALTLLLTSVYTGVLSFQLYGDYVETGQPVAINGRYLIPLLPLVAVTLIQAMRYATQRISSRLLAAVSVLVVLGLLVSGAGISTYIVLAESHWFWPGFGQQSHALFESILERFVLPFRY